MKNLKLKIIKLLGFKISIRVKKNIPNEDEAYTSYPIDKIVVKHRNNLMVEQINSFLKLSKIRYDKHKIVEYISEFDYVFSKSPAEEHESGFGYNEGVCFLQF